MRISLKTHNYSLTTRYFFAYGFGPSPPDDPANTFFPSLSVTLVAFRRLEPSLASDPLTVTFSPTLRSFRVQPRLMSIAGAASSTSQLTTFPAASFTSMKNRACGLIQSTFVTGPVRIAGLFLSYCAANEWCARRVCEQIPKTITPRTAAVNEAVVFINYFAPT